MLSNKKGKLNSYTLGKYVDCHTRGNHRIWTSLEGGTLYAGGWIRGAYPWRGMAVIDLREDSEFSGVRPLNSIAKRDFQRTIEYEEAAYLHLPLKDFGVPPYNVEFWEALAADVSAILARGDDVLIACDGGHGRTGTVVAILLQYLDPKPGNPVQRLRRQYCYMAVETTPQVKYVYDMTGYIPPVSATPVATETKWVDELTDAEWEEYYRKIEEDDIKYGKRFGGRVDG